MYALELFDSIVYCVNGESAFEIPQTIPSRKSSPVGREGVMEKESDMPWQTAILAFLAYGKKTYWSTQDNPLDTASARL